MNWKQAIAQVQVEEDKTCTTCGETKPAEAFHRRRNRAGIMTRRAQCRVCFHKQRGRAGARCRNG